MTDFERNYFGTGPRPSSIPASASSVPRKRGVLVRSNSNRDSQLTDEWQPEQEEQQTANTPATNGESRRTSSLRRPVASANPVSSSTGSGVSVKKEVNFVSPTKSDAEQTQQQHPHRQQRLTSNGEKRPHLRQNSETETQPHPPLVHQRQYSSSSGAEEACGGGSERNKSGRQGTNYSTILPGNSKRDLSVAQGTGDNGGGDCHQREAAITTTPNMARDCDWNTAAEAISYYSDSTGSNSVTVPSAVATCQPRIHSSSWSLSSNWGGGVAASGPSKVAPNHDDNRFGTIRSVQSECRTSSTSHLNRSGSLRRSKGRSNHSLCSCDAETEVRAP